MRLLTHNLLACHAKGCGSSSNNFPLKLQNVQLELIEAEYNDTFLKGFLPKLAWPAFVSTARDVRSFSRPNRSWVTHLFLWIPPTSWNRSRMRPSSKHCIMSSYRYVQAHLCSSYMLWRERWSAPTVLIRILFVMVFPTCSWPSMRFPSSTTIARDVVLEWIHKMGQLFVQVHGYIIGKKFPTTKPGSSNGSRLIVKHQVQGIDLPDGENSTHLVMTDWDVFSKA